MSGFDVYAPLETAVGKKTAATLARAFGYQTVWDFLWHLPRRYSKRGELTPLRDVPLGEHVTIIAQILDVKERTMASRRGSILEVRVTDGTGHINLTFFNQSWRKSHLIPGVRGQFAGKITEYRGTLQLQNPDYELFESGSLDSEQDIKLREAAALAYSKKPMPTYPATAAMPSWAIAKAMLAVLDGLGEVADPVPASVRAGAGVLPLGEALRLAHDPETDEEIHAAIRTLKFHEAFLLQTGLILRRAQHNAQQADARPFKEAGLLATFDAAMPFTYTPDQVSVGAEISHDLSQTTPMNRLLQGEVGSGKTLVALRAMLQVAETGGQSALLAPTEVLAAQHYRSLCKMLGEEMTAKLKPILLTGKISQKDKRRILLDIAAGVSLLVIGTHALFSETTTFADLGLVVVDEQHKFGVDQRESLRGKGKRSPHMLAMTATPIPRTVALTAFGDLEISTLRTMPAGRAGVQTFAVNVVSQAPLEQRAWTRLLEEVRRGHQGYIVCSAISATEDESGGELSESSGRGRANVMDVFNTLKTRPDFHSIKMEMLTGKTPAEDKERIMRSFESGEIDVLVATTVIEVGVNVPNATIMLILEADRFGISQLHQLRGRVGRGELPGLCLLLTEAAEDSPAWERVQAIADVSDGFVLAEIDMEQRKEGDILGVKQSGAKATLRLLRVAKDGEIIEQARLFATEIVAADPDLDKAPVLKDALAREAARAAGIVKS